VREKGTTNRRQPDAPPNTSSSRLSRPNPRETTGARSPGNRLTACNPPRPSRGIQHLTSPASA
jgi:hypothetical protein